MLTIRQAFDIFRECVYKITGVIVGEGSGDLRSFGIDTSEKLAQLKSMIVTDVASRFGEGIPLSDLHFDEDDSVEKVYWLLASSGTTLLPMRENDTGGTAFRPTGRKPPRKAGKKPPRKAAKKGPKMATKKPKGKGGHVKAGRGGGRLGVAARTGANRRGVKKGELALREGRRKSSEGDELGLDEAAMVREDVGFLEGPGPGGVGGNGGGDDVIPASPQRAPKRIVKATPQMELRKELVPQKSYLVGVFVNQDAPAAGADVDEVVAEIPLGLHEFDLEVWLDCSHHFHLDNVTNTRVKVNADTGVSDELSFQLNVVKDPDESPMYVSAFFRYNQRPSGKIMRYLEWAGSKLRWKRFSPAKQAEGEVVLPRADTSPAVVLEPKGIPADIRVEVLAKSRSGQSFRLKCFTPGGKWEGDWDLPQASKDLVNNYMKKFMEDKGEARIASLEGAGMDFWDSLPREARAVLWDALENGAATMSVVSEEPYIPWELMLPYGDVQNPRRPLGIELQMGRWIAGNYQSARQGIPLKSGYVISPKTSGLKGAAQEVGFLTKTLKPKFGADEVVPASFTGVNQGLAAGPRDVVHFICHGKSAALQTVMLETPDTLNCSQVRTLKGFKAAFKNGPLAFLNACEVGGQIVVLDGVGGFVNSFIQMGASAVVAPLWAVQDSVAPDVTEIFYTEGLKGVPFGKVMQQIRSKAYSQALDSYAAYCFYGDPMASLV